MPGLLWVQMELLKNIKILILSSLFLFFSACSSGPVKGEHTLHRILLYNLHYRRPSQVGAMPTAEVGEKEYVSNPKPNKAFDCEPLNSLFKDIHLREVRKCFLSSSILQAEKPLSYRLRRNTAPYLQLQESEDTPDCIKQALEKIPVPREIFFQSNEEGALSCYNARIPILDEELLGIRNALHPIEVKIDLPLDEVPKTDQETLVLLGTWVISSFFQNNPNQLQSKTVPRDLCGQCLGEKNVFSDGEPLPPLWPE